MSATNAALVCLLLAAGDAPEAPLVGRPADLPFSGASAGFAAVGPGPEYVAPFAVSVAATPAEVEELEPVTLEVTVRAVGSVLRPPSRLDLRRLPAFSRRFHIEDVTDGKKAEDTSTVWRWVYRLRPRAAGVAEVPGLPFVFYNPDVRPAGRGFQVIWTDPLPLRVATAERHAPPVEAARAALAVVTGERVLRARPAWGQPGVALALLGLAGPPCGCLAWYLAWRRRYPDAARLAREHRSRAARHALRSLEAARRQRGRPCAEAVAAALGGYLRERFEFPGVEPGPDEAIAWLAARGVEPVAAERAGRLLDACAEGRFQPEHDLTEDLPGRCRDWIISIDEGSCPHSS